MPAVPAPDSPASLFPASVTLDEARAAAAAANARLGLRAFVEAPRGDHVLFDYSVAASGGGAFPAPDTGDPAADRERRVLRELRGIAFCARSGEAVHRPLHKFFNVGERAETRPEAIDWSRQHRVFEKLDGTMVAPFFGIGPAPAGDAAPLAWYTRLGDTRQARAAGAHAARSGLPYGAFASAQRRLGRTAVFEWLDPGERIVVGHAAPRLVLLALRDIATGAYAPAAEADALASAVGIPAAASRPDPVCDAAAFLAETEALQGAEGWVVRFDDGDAVKAKGAWYRRVHKLKESLSFEKDVWSLALRGGLDDLLPFLTDPERENLAGFARRLHGEIAAAAGRVRGRLEEGVRASGGDRAAFAAWAKANADGWDRTLLFAALGGREVEGEIRRAVADHLSSQTRLDRVRGIVGGLRWEPVGNAPAAG